MTTAIPDAQRWPGEPPEGGAGARGPAAALAAATTRVRRYLRFLGCEWALAEDFAQEAVVAAIDRFDGEPAPLPWLLTAARNAFRMHLRQQGRRREVADVDALHAQWVEVAGDDAADARLDALRECLRQLPARSRRAVELRYGGTPRRAVAAALGIGDEGAKSMLTRLRDQLAACVARRLSR